jgi:mRNA interferase MazF
VNGIHPRRGEIWGVDTPNRPDDPHQPRRAIVISEDARNELRDHSIVVMIYSRGALGPTHVAIQRGTIGLDHDSIVLCEEVSTLDHRFFRYGPLGSQVPDHVLRQIVRAIRIALDDDTLQPS